MYSPTRKEISEFINKKLNTIKCPLCENRVFGLIRDHFKLICDYIFTDYTDSERLTVIEICDEKGTAYHVPFVVIFCTDCGFMANISLKIIKDYFEKLKSDNTT